MESIEKLRNMDDGMLVPLGNGQYVPDYSHNDIADEIEAEIAEWYMELPTDADGVPIKIRDKVVIPQCYEGIVVSIEVGVMETLIGVDGHDGYLRYRNSDIRHFKPRTLEDVLEDMLNEKDRTDLCSMGLISKYAAEIRELLGVSE